MKTCFNEIISHPVPLNMNTLTALKRSPLGLDLYLWLVYRTFPLRAPLRLTWRQSCTSQFGVEPGHQSQPISAPLTPFVTKCLRELNQDQGWLGRG